MFRICWLRWTNWDEEHKNAELIIFVIKDKLHQQSKRCNHLNKEEKTTKAHLITRKGWQTLDRELKYLWKQYRPEITKKVQAAAQGDRSENADYTYNKRLLRQIDSRCVIW